MNAATKMMYQNQYSFFQWVQGLLRRQSMVMLSLLFIVLLSAIAIIYCKNLERRLINEVQMAEQEQQMIEEEKSQLLLEQSTWSTLSRVQHIAGRRIGLHKIAVKNSVEIYA